jgi:hypothetical protein
VPLIRQISQPDGRTTCDAGSGAQHLRARFFVSQPLPRAILSFGFFRSAAGCHGLDDRFSRYVPHRLGLTVPQRHCAAHRNGYVLGAGGPQRGADELNIIGWYLWLMIASILRFVRQPPGTAARRVLLPYAVFTLLMNAGLAIATATLQALEFSSQFTPGPNPFCSPANTLYRLMLATPVVMNDALLVSHTFISPSESFLIERDSYTVRARFTTGVGAF